MFTIVKDLPQNIIGIKVSGKTTQLDYDAINPIMEIEDEQNRRAKLLVEVENLDYTAAVFFTDIKSSFNYQNDISAMAVVSDKNWLNKETDIFGKLLPGLSAKRFALNEYEKALHWLRQQ